MTLIASSMVAPMVKKHDICHDTAVPDGNHKTPALHKKIHNIPQNAITFQHLTGCNISDYGRFKGTVCGFWGNAVTFCETSHCFLKCCCRFWKAIVWQNQPGRQNKCQRCMFVQTTGMLKLHISYYSSFLSYLFYRHIVRLGCVL